MDPYLRILGAAIMGALDPGFALLLIIFSPGELDKLNRADCLHSQVRRPSTVNIMSTMDIKHHPAPETSSMGTKESVITGSTAGQSPQSPPEASPPPDGGFNAWLQVFSSWCVIFCTFGLVNTFGVYQTYYEDALPDSSSSDISWIGSMQGCILLCGGMISGPLYDAGYFVELIWGGLFLIVFGQFMTSLCTTYWQVVLAQGLCIGVGCGIVFLPSTAIISQYFSNRRSLATGISSSGSPLAGVILPIVFNQLLQKVGFAWATRCIAFILLAVAITPLVFLRTRLPPSKHHRALVDTSAFKEATFLTFAIGGFFAFVGLYIPFFYIELFTLEHGLASRTFSPYMVTFMNAGSIIGRVVPPYIADHTGAPALVMATMSFLSAVLAFIWLGIRNSSGMVVFAVLYGMISGGVVSLQPAGVFSFTSDMSRVGTRLGMTCFVSGIAVLIGSPIAGVILGDGREARWNGLIGFTADCLLIASGLILATGYVALSRKRRMMRECELASSTEMED
ncbi:major facilitator superfamily domain-containing protein [Pseudomassariella vexata]|uniref:Major facilitator superfamily domain-containing protein n=1 Tax=Pseudomassariella vexata TaxID=1141098 RepID=A0A1Y2E504_9PEZI|nr:major facilitator superfamily domain-containing protein [Pseudomassariella vexata]ORY66592.1 major facilitator superfamily domain-containing protein [Pseudomassariella vexata]